MNSMCLKPYDDEDIDWSERIVTAWAKSEEEEEEEEKEKSK